MATISTQGARQQASRMVTKQSKPVLWWSALGMVFFAVIAVTVGQWLLGPGFTPAPTGTDPLPSSVEMWITAIEVFFSTCTLVCLWFYLIKPWIKARHITWDGIFMLACFTMYYQDPIDNYFNFTFTYNGHFHNMSSWAPYIPGWVSPRAENFAEPYFLMASIFMWLFFAMSVLGCWLLRKFKEWLPGFSFPVHVGIIFLLIALFDFLLEGLFTHTHIFAYTAVYSPLSIWAGTPYQFPLYEATGVAALGIGCVLIRYFRDDHGNSVFERGLQNLSLPQPAKRLLSFFSLVAGMQLAIFFCFYGQYQWFALKADSFAKYPSYQLLEICGRGTPYACPTSEVPMPKRGSLSIGPDDPRLSPDSKRN